MRFRGTLLLALLAGVLGGCISEQPLRSTSWLDRFRGSPGPLGLDVVHMEVDLIERPTNDLYINQGLWQRTDEQKVDLERKAVLEENGLRVGLLSGILPPQFDALLKSERSCANPRMIIFHAGDPKTLVLGPTLPVCDYQLQHNGEPEPVALEQALCTLVVTANLTEDGRTRLRFTPQIKHGGSVLEFRTAPNGQELMMQVERQTENYSWMAWEVTVGPNEYVLVGGRIDRLDSLGHQCFIRHGESRGVQRLLALRVGRSLPGITPETADGEPPGSGAYQKSPSLAVQASMTAVRGSSH